MTFEELMRKQKFNYQIFVLRNKQGKTYKELAKQFNVSSSRIEQRNRDFLHIVYSYYTRYLESINIEFDSWDIYCFYQYLPFAIAYLEKTYKKHLDLLRQGKPPIMFENSMNLVPYRKIKNDEMIRLQVYILYEREEEKRTFSDICKDIALTKEKTRDIYYLYYHRKNLIVANRVKQAGDCSIDEYLYNRHVSPKTKWKFIASRYSEFAKDLID